VARRHLLGEDPNDLDAPYARLVGTLAEGSVTHVVVSPSACYSGLPSRYDGRYVLGVWHDTRDAVRTMLEPAGSREDGSERWIDVC
jgi:hypothetical protein